MRRSLSSHCPAILIAVAATLLASTGSMARAAVASVPRKPNIILILADDLGWRDLGCCGSTFYETPHLDALARQGMKFTSAYAAAAVCSPARASLLTGKYPARLHLTHIIQAAPARKGNLRDPDWTPYLPLEEVTLAKALKSAGYATAIIGKWHLGGHPGRSGAGAGEEGDPRRQGFDVNVGGSDMGQPPDYFFPYSRTLSGNRTVRLANLEGGKSGEYLTDRLTDEAEAFLAQHKDRPFFLFLSHFAPHTAMGDRLQAKEASVSRFKKKVNPQDTQHDPVYAAMVASLDDSVGRIVKKLDDLGIAEKTLVIFTSDNGGYQPKTSNLPLRGAKGMPYEGGLRVPALVRWPGQVKPGSVSDVPVITPDFYPTLLEATGVKAGAGQVVDGCSLMPLLTGSGRLERTALYWHYPHCDTEPYSVVREGDYKLIEFLTDGRCELYNLRDAAEENTNLAERMPAKVAGLRQALTRWRQSVGAQLPVPVSAPAPAAGADKVPEGFSSLFNGKDLSGWKVLNGKMDAWGADNGILFVHGGGGGWLMTEKEYGDFEVRLEFKMPRKGNSGVALRAPFQGDPAYQGMEIQLLDDENYKGIKPTQYTGAIYDVVPPAKQVTRPAGEWQKIRIVAKGRQITVELNGTQIVNANLEDYKDRVKEDTEKKLRAHPGLLRPSGHLGLQSHDGRVEFRNLFVKPL